jgi:hypothetical protein
VQAIGSLVEPAFTSDGFHAVEAFHSLPEDSVDVIAYGSSHCWKGFNAQTVEENYGLSVYNYGYNWQYINTTSLFIQDSLRTQSPKVILIETFHVNYVHENEDLCGEIYYTKAIPDFKAKQEYLAQCFGDNPGRYLSYYVPLFAFHDNWENIAYYNFADVTTVESFLDARGYLESDTVYPTEFPDYTTFEQKELSDSAIAVLDNLVQICQEKGIEIIFYTAPYDGEFNYSDAMTKYAEENNCAYLDFFQLLEEANLDGATDLQDYEHLNTSGASKIADYLGQYIVDHYSP